MTGNKKGEKCINVKSDRIGLTLTNEITEKQEPLMFAMTFELKNEILLFSFLEERTVSHFKARALATI